MFNTTLVDAEVRVLHPEARDPDYAIHTSEPVKNKIMGKTALSLFNL